MTDPYCSRTRLPIPGTLPGLPIQILFLLGAAGAAILVSHTLSSSIFRHTPALSVAVGLALFLVAIRLNLVNRLHACRKLSVDDDLISSIKQDINVALMETQVIYPCVRPEVRDFGYGLYPMRSRPSLLGEANFCLKIYRRPIYTDVAEAHSYFIKRVHVILKRRLSGYSLAPHWGPSLSYDGEDIFGIPASDEYRGWFNIWDNTSGKAQLSNHHQMQILDRHIAAAH